MEKADLIKLATIIGHYEGTLEAVNVVLNNLKDDQISHTAKTKLRLHVARALKNTEPSATLALKNLAASVKAEPLIEGIEE